MAKPLGLTVEGRSPGAKQGASGGTAASAGPPSGDDRESAVPPSEGDDPESAVPPSEGDDPESTAVASAGPPSAPFSLESQPSGRMLRKPRRTAALRMDSGIGIVMGSPCAD